MTFSATRTLADPWGPSSWWRRVAPELREQWIFAALLGLVCCGDVLLMVEAGGPTTALVPGTTVLALIAVGARRDPIRCGYAAAVVLGLSTALWWASGLRAPGSIGIDGVRPGENAAGLLLVLYLFRGRSARSCAPVAGALVLSCMTAVVLRGGHSVAPPTPSLTETFGIGFLEFVLAAGTGVYLRGRSSPSAPIPALVLKQWPVMAVLFTLITIDVATREPPFPDAVVVLPGAVVMSALAVFAPARPVGSGVAGALALVLLAVALRAIGVESHSALETIPVPCIAASMVLLGTAARQTESGAAVRVGTALAGSALFALVVIPGKPHDGSLSESIGPLFIGVLLAIISAGAGLYLRTRDEERATSLQAAIASAHHRERMALARELHDVVAHHVTGIVVQAQAAHLVSEKDAQAADKALERIVESGTEALVSMRRLVAGMRDADPSGASDVTELATTDLQSDLDSVVERARRVVPDHGTRPDVTLSTELERAIPPEVARSALRVVQESLTNIAKHATAPASVDIVVRSTPTHLHVQVHDDGEQAGTFPSCGPGGFGLIGMRERVELLGGRFSAGPGHQGGWCVEAWLPLEEQHGHGGIDDPGADRR